MDILSRMLRKIVVFVCLIAMCCGIGKGIHWAKKGFTIRRIAAPVRWKLEFWDNEADRAILQPFRYLGRGRQCFAFASLDGQYVLKLPRTDIYQIPFWMRALPLPSIRKEQLLIERRNREEFVLNSMKIAYEELQSDTGVLGIHFGQTTNLGKELTIIDALGCRYRLLAHKTAYVLQKKHPILMRVFLETLHSGDRRKAQEILDAMIDVVVARGRKGIWNKDESFLRNYGFDGLKGYQIDIGSFYRKSDGAASIYDTLHPVRTWLQTAAPELLDSFDKSLEKRMADSLDLFRN